MTKPNKLFISLTALTLSFTASVAACTKTAESAASSAGSNEAATVKIEQDAAASKSLTETALAQADSPSQAVREFYRLIRAKRFREAISMTNWKPAVEGLSDAEYAELNTDFAALAEQVPENVDISGEQISGSTATVFIKTINPDTGKPTQDAIQMRKENGKWLFLLGTEETEKAVKAAGKNYFFDLRIETHQIEAEKLFERIAKAQIGYASQFGGKFGDVAELVDANLLAPEIFSDNGIGYKFSLKLSDDKKKYTAAAEPSVYGKTGKLSYQLQAATDAKQMPRLKSEDKKGAPL